VPTASTSTVKKDEPTIARDFFGRPIVVAPKPVQPEFVPSTQVGASPQKVALLRFKFHEGITNAVRRPVYLQDML